MPSVAFFVKRVTTGRTFFYLFEFFHFLRQYFSSTEVFFNFKTFIQKVLWINSSIYIFSHPFFNKQKWSGLPNSLVMWEVKPKGFCSNILLVLLPFMFLIQYLQIYTPKASWRHFVEKFHKWRSCSSGSLLLHDFSSKQSFSFLSQIIISWFCS